MTPLASAAVDLYLNGSAAAADTIFMQTSSTRGWFETVTGVASGIMTLTLMIMAIALVPAAWNFRKTYQKTAALLDRVQADVAPLIKHAHSIADNVNYISTAVRADVSQIHGTLAEANERIQQAIGVTERRINEFNALLAVVQEEAEGVFVSTAATVRGVRTGASHFASGVGPELASVEPDDADLEAGVDDEEIDDGYDFDSDSDDDSDSPRTPRIIRRTRTRG
jgi:uncharacterized protein YoxC